MRRALGVVFTCICLLHVSVGIVNPRECRSLMDLFFVIDGSDSITPEDFGRLRQALRMMVEQTDLGPHKARIGMLVYSSTIPTASKHTFSSDRNYLVQATKTLQHPRAGTKTDLGLQDMIEIFDTYGRKDKNIPRVCITITDGASLEPDKTIYQANRAAQRGISMFAVGIGEKIALNELNAIASSKQQVKRMNNFSDLLSILTEMMVTICPCPIPPKLPYSKCTEGPRAIGSERWYECEPGYHLVGNPKITCQNDFTWTSISTDFVCIPCSDNTPNVDYGYCLGGNNTIGTKRKYQCLDGYRPRGNPIIECLEDATWGQPTFNCLPCGEPEQIVHGQCLGDTKMIGSTRKLVCDPGYMAVGDPELICIDDMDFLTPVWKNSLPFSCVPCKEPDAVQHGRCLGGDITINSTRKLVCDPGYMAVGDPVLICSEDIQFLTPVWKNSLPFSCVPCKEPDAVQHGQCLGGDITIGSTRELICDPGYMAVGDPVLICSEDIQFLKPVWKNSLPFKCVPCKEPDAVQHGQCLGGDITINSTRKLVCDPGYMAVGDPVLICSEDIQFLTPVWKNSLPFSCVPCKEPDAVQHGQCLGGDITIGSTRELICDPGYMAVGDPVLICSEDIQFLKPVWKNSLPFKCVPCKEPDAVQHGQCLGGDITIGSTRELICDPGYMAVGDPVLICSEDIQFLKPVWKNSLPFSCVPCKEPDAVQHGQCLGGDITIGSTRELICDPGYMAVGDPVLICSEDIQFLKPVWKNSLPFSCVPCKEPDAVEHGRCLGGDITINSTRKLVCDPGYMAVGDPVLICSEDIQFLTPVWKNSLPFSCVPCKEPDAVQHGQCLGGDITIGSTRELICDTGFRAVGNAVIECIANNDFLRPQWSTSDFKCLPCGETPIIPYGSCGGGNYTIGSIRHLSCEEGYFPVGVPRVRCLDDLSYDTPVWTPNYDFRCVICENPPYIANAYVYDGPKTVGSTRQYDCDYQFTMTGRGTRTCNDRGEWEGPAFSCDAMVSTTPFPVSPDPSMCDSCRVLNGVGYNNHPSDCNQYVQCYIGARGMEPVYRRCAFGEFWDQEVLTCRYPEDAKCPHDKCSLDSTLVAYKHTDPNMCCAYWECQNGHSSGKCCSEGYSFSTIHNKCVVDGTCVNKCPYEDEMPACSLRAIVGKPTKFEQHIGNGFWVEMFCGTGTQFNHVTCSCSDFVTVQVLGQPRVCTPDLDLPFMNGFEDISKNKATVNSMGVTIKDGTAYFDGRSRLLINYFSNNEYGDEVVITFKYKEVDEYMDDLQALVTNGDCDDDPSVIIAKMQGYVLMGAKAKSSYSFAIPTTNVQWKEVIYHKSPDKLEGQVCGGSSFGYVYGNIRRTKCALQIGYGTGLQPFRGYIADFKMYRCRPVKS